MKMDLNVFDDKVTLGKAAAEQAARAIRNAIHERGQARIIAATAASQLEFLDALTKSPGIDWRNVEVFHLDEYIGLPIDHPGSFRKMLVEQLITQTGITRFHLLDGDADASEVNCRVCNVLADDTDALAIHGDGVYCKNN